MPAPVQPSTAVFTNTSNINRFNTNYHKHRAENQPGYALAKALNAFSGAVLGGATKQKAEDVEEGKQLAMMGVERSNLNEASGKSSGPFSFNSGWTSQGFDIQRGTDDGFLRGGQLIDDYNKSGLHNNDDPEAFRAWQTAQRTEVLSGLEGKSEYYREGYMQSVAKNFRDAGRAHAGHMSTFRTAKKQQVMRARVRSSIRSGGASRTDGSTDIAQLASELTNAPKEHGLSHTEAKGAAALAVVDSVAAGEIDPEDVTDKSIKNFNKADQERIRQAALNKQQEIDLETNAAEQAERDERQALQTSAIDGDADASAEALSTLKQKYPEDYQAALYHVNQEKSGGALTHSQRLTRDSNLSAFQSNNDPSDPEFLNNAHAAFIDQNISRQGFEQIKLRHKYYSSAQEVLNRPVSNSIQGMIHSVIVQPDNLTTAPHEVQHWMNKGDRKSVV